MVARLVLTAGIMAVTVCGMSGQTRTADGVMALARGDFQRAVEILKPIAEDPWTDDVAAQFFMAGLYETGRGVPADLLRACALYMRAASSSPDTPFGMEASILFGASISRGLEFNHECQTLAMIGFDSGLERVTFDLGPGHSVEWTLSAATVTYEGRTKRQEMMLPTRGARVMPLQHTELATGPTRAAMRHFIEVFVWQPSAKQGPWTLQWHVFEVVRDEIIRIDIPDSLVTVDGDAPPSPESFDVRDYALLRVDDDGNAEWAVLKGPRHRTERIESDAERREVRDEALARDAALKRVDWKGRYDANRQPAMTYVDADGCGHVQVYGWSADRAEAVVVRAASAALDLAGNPATFDLSRESMSIAVDAYVYAAPQRRFDFCSDVRMPTDPDAIGPETWRAIAGTVTIELSPEGVRARAPHLRRATVRLTNLRLRNAAGATVTVSRPLTLSAIVGWFAG